MDLLGWNERYRSAQRPGEDLLASPTRLVVETAKNLPSGRALDLACGSGRNALWLAGHGWRVTSVDGAETAIGILRQRAAERNLDVTAVVADLQAEEFVIDESSWDLIVIAYYLQRDLFGRAKAGVKPGGVLISIAHTTEPGEKPTAHRLTPGDLRKYFLDWELLHEYEGRPNDAAHHRSVAEIVARRPHDHFSLAEASIFSEAET